MMLFILSCTIIMRAASELFKSGERYLSGDHHHVVSRKDAIRTIVFTRVLDILGKETLHD